MPLFADVYNALLKKGVEFPGSDSAAAVVPKASSNSDSSPVKSKKNV
jgi:hypothetical protein